MGDRFVLYAKPNIGVEYISDCFKVTRLLKGPADKLLQRWLEINLSKYIYRNHGKKNKIANKVTDKTPLLISF